MSNTREQLVDRFVAWSGVGKKQSARGTGLANADIDTRDKCTITREEVINRRQIRDCRNEDLTNSKINNRLARWTFQYEEVTPQIIARFDAYDLGTVAAPTGTPANEVQTLTRSGTVSGGTFTLSLTLEGRTVTTKPIAFDASTATIQAALTAARMRFIQPGDVVVTGTWGTAMTLTFGGRLAHANLPLVVVDATLLTGSTPDIVEAQGTAGDQNFHAFTRSTSRDKILTSFALGYETDSDAVEKFVDVYIESVTPSAADQNGNVSLTVVAISPWEPDSIETTFAIPECVNPEPLRTEDCRFEINSSFQSEDVNAYSFPIVDNVPTDQLSMFPYDGIDPERAKRGRQPNYAFTMGIFGNRDSVPYVLAQNERTQVPVEVVAHFGMPGNRYTRIYPKAHIQFQNNRDNFIGEGEYSSIQIEGVPFKDGTASPVSGEAYIDQSTAFLTT